jgi:hypothetical protein
VKPIRSIAGLAHSIMRRGVGAGRASALPLVASMGLGQMIPGQASTAQAQVLADGMSATIETLKDDVVGRLASCESGGHPENDAAIILDVNRAASIGKLQFQTRTVVHYMKEIEGRGIDAKEAVEIALDTERASSLAKKIIFDRDGARHWHNCAKKLGLYHEVRSIQKLAK